MTDYVIFLGGLAQQWRPRKIYEIWHRGEDDARTLNTRIAQRKRAIPHLTMNSITYTTQQRHIDRTCVVVTALCNQPEAFTLDLGDDQSRFLFINLFCLLNNSPVPL